MRGPGMVSTSRRKSSALSSFGPVLGLCSTTTVTMGLESGWIILPPQTPRSDAGHNAGRTAIASDAQEDPPPVHPEEDQPQRQHHGDAVQERQVWIARGAEGR